jgi:hypothetical protein
MDKENMNKKSKRIELVYKFLILLIGFLIIFIIIQSPTHPSNIPKVTPSTPTRTLLPNLETMWYQVTLYASTHYSTATPTSAASPTGTPDISMDYTETPTGIPSMSASLLSSYPIITGTMPNPSSPGQAVSVTVSVSGSGATPTGQVIITGADTKCTITLAGGSGSCNMVFNTTGSKILTALYSGNSIYSSSSATESHMVITGNSVTTTTITSHMPDPSTPGQVVAVSVTVGGSGPLAPTGTVNITGADINCVILLAGGIGNCSVAFNTTGHKILAATYSGDFQYPPSSGFAGHTVFTGTPDSTTTIITPLTPYPTFTFEEQPNDIASQLMQIDKTLQQEISSNIIFNKPKSMNIGQTIKITLLLNPSESPTQLESELATQFTSTITTNETFESSTINITPLMQAKLISPNEGIFIIKAVHENDIQVISGTETTEWSWLVTAKQGGTQTLELVIYRLLKYEGVDHWRMVETYHSPITVKVTFRYWINSLDWKKVLGGFITLLLIPLLWRLIDRRQKKDKMPSGGEN